MGDALLRVARRLLVKEIPLNNENEIIDQQPPLQKVKNKKKVFVLCL